MALPVSPVCSNRFPVAPPVTPPTEPSGGGNGRGGKGGGNTMDASLVSYWNLNDNISGTFTAAADGTGTNSLTSSGAGAGTYQTSEAKYRSAVKNASGTARWLQKTSPTDLAPGESWTLTTWVNYFTSSGITLADNGIMGVWSTGTDKAWVLKYANAANHPDGAQGIYVAVSADGSAEVELGDGGDGGPLDTWYFVCVRYNHLTQTLSIRINDNADNTLGSVAALNASSETFKIYHPNTGSSASAHIGPTGFWKRRLIDREVDALFQGGAGLLYSDLATFRNGRSKSRWVYSSLANAGASNDNWNDEDKIRICASADSKVCELKKWDSLEVDGYDGLFHEYALNTNTAYTPTLVASEGADDPDTWTNYTDNPLAGTNGVDYSYDTNAGRARMRDLGTATDSRFRLDSNEDTDSVTSANGFLIIDDLVGTNTLDGNHSAIVCATRLDGSNIYFAQIQERAVASGGNATNWVAQTTGGTWTSTGLGKTTAGRVWMYVVGSSCAYWVNGSAAPIVTGTTSSTATSGFPRSRMNDGNSTNSDDTKIELGPHVFGTLT